MCPLKGGKIPILFALVALSVSVLVDLVLWGGNQGFQPREQLESALLSHAAIHGAILLLAALAAMLSFAIMPGSLPSVRLASVLGGIAGIVAPFAGIAAMAAFGLLAGAGAVFVVALLISGIGSLSLRAMSGQMRR